MSDFETTQLRGIIQGLGPPNAGLSAINPATTLATTLYRDRTPVTGGYYECMPNGAGVNAWVPLGAPAALTGWSKYVVSNQATPLAPYVTIEAAIAAAVADGHVAARPAVVMVLPGTYAPAGGVLALPEGLSLMAMSTGGEGGNLSFTGGDVVVQAGLLLPGTSPSVHTITGLRFEPPPGTSALQISGAAPLEVAIKTSLFFSSLAPTAVLDNTANVGPAPTTVTFLHTTLVTADVAPGSTVLVNTGVRLVAGFGLLIQGAAANPAVVLGTGVGIGLESSTVFGNFVIGPNSQVGILKGSVRATAVMFDMTGGDFNSRANYNFATLYGTNPLAAGPGFVVGSYNVTNDPESELLVASQQKAPATLSYVAPSIRQLYSSVSAGVSPFAYPIGTDVFYVDTGEVAVVVQLPPLATMMDGVTLIVKSLNVAGDIAVTPAAGDEIDGLGVGNPSVLVAPPLVGYASRTFRVSTAGTGRVGKWLSFA